MRGNAVQEPTIMADDHDTTSKLQQGILQRSQGLHIQVIGRLIQEEHIGASYQGLGQMQSTPLTAGEGAHSFLLITTIEIKASTIGSAGHFKLTNGQYIESTRDVLPNGLVIA